MKPITYPARPINGGPLDKALPKVGMWHYEPKYNGWRTLVHVPSGTMFNRHGAPLSIQSEFTEALGALQNTRLQWLDCEAIERRHGIGRGSLIILDLVAAGTYMNRRFTLEMACKCAGIEPLKALNLPIPDNTVWLTMGYREAGASQLWDLLKECNTALGCPFYEGVVAKEINSTYPIQLRSPSEEFGFWMKHRWKF